MAWGRKPAGGVDDLVAKVAAAEPGQGELFVMPFRRTAPGDIAALARAIATHDTLKTFCTSSHSLEGADLEAVRDMLASVTSLQTLSVGNRSFGDEGMSALAPGLASNGSLTALDLQAKGITATGAAALAGSIGTCTSLRQLLLARNDLGAAGIAALGESVGCRRLAHLDLSETGMTAAATAPLHQMVSSGACRLEVVNVSSNPLGAPGSAALFEALLALPCLRQLHSADCQLQRDHAQALLRGLARRGAAASPLSCVELSRNPAIGGEAAARLVCGLGGHARGPEGLTLAISGCELGLEHAAVIGAWCSDVEVGGHAPLRRLELADCGISNEHLRALLPGLRRVVGELRLFNNGIDDAAAGFIADHAGVVAAGEAEAQLKSKQEEGGGGAEAAAAAGAEGEAAAPWCAGHLRELDLSGNGLTDAGALPLIEALAGSARRGALLGRLVLAANDLSDEVRVRVEALSLAGQLHGLRVVLDRQTK